MSSEIYFSPRLHWSTSGGVFDWLLTQVAKHSHDPALRDFLHEIVDNNLGSFEFGHLAPAQRTAFSDITRRWVLEESRSEFGGRQLRDVVTPQIEALVSLLSSLKDADIELLT